MKSVGVELTITDTSVGIAEEHLSELFETHYQCVLNSNKQLPISALALVLSSKLIDMHHGNISVDSELTKGTTFTIWLPLSPTNT
jgi:two-component system phosphate regulon sensor histidine kinase PhoR